MSRLVVTNNGKISRLGGDTLGRERELRSMSQGNITLVLHWQLEDNDARDWLEYPTIGRSITTDSRSSPSSRGEISLLIGLT
jgi:hypothetical protein